MEEIQGLVSNLGFPIVCCYFMYKQVLKQNEQQQELNKSIAELTLIMKLVVDKLSIDTKKEEIKNE